MQYSLLVIFLLLLLENQLEISLSESKVKTCCVVQTFVHVCKILLRAVGIFFVMVVFYVFFQYFS